MRPTSSAICGFLKACLPQWVFFTGGASGTSRKELVDLTPIRSHFCRKSSTFFTTAVTGFSPFYDMGI